MTPDQLPPTHLLLMTKVLPESRANLIQIFPKITPASAEKAAERLIKLTAKTVYELIDLGDEGAFWGDLRQQSAITLKAVVSTQERLACLLEKDRTVWEVVVGRVRRKMHDPPADIATTLALLKGSLEMMMSEARSKAGRPRHNAGRSYFSGCARIWEESTKRPLPVNTSNKQEPSPLFLRLKAIALEMCKNDKHVRAALSPLAYRAAARARSKSILKK